MVSKSSNYIGQCSPSRLVFLWLIHGDDPNHISKSWEPILQVVVKILSSSPRVSSSSQPANPLVFREVRKAKGVTPRAVSDEEICERCGDLLVQGLGAIKTDSKFQLIACEVKLLLCKG